jgi:ABC-type multidrug transport system fused ATPase/permease subunit
VQFHFSDHVLDVNLRELTRGGESVALLQKVRTDIERFVNALINIFFSSVVGVAFLVWYAVTRHWLLIPVFVFGVLVLGGLTGLLSEKIKSTQRTIVRQTAKILGAMSESLRNIELVKSLGLANQEVARLNGTAGSAQTILGGVGSGESTTVNVKGFVLYFDDTLYVASKEHVDAYAGFDGTAFASQHNVVTLPGQRP